MMDLIVLKNRKDEIEKSMKCLEYAPTQVGERALLDLEAFRELVSLREGKSK